MREAKKYTENFINQKRALGELDHPDSSVVNLQNTSHNVTEMHFNGDDLVGTVEVLGTPSGNILKELFKSGIKLGISSRGLGSVESVGDGSQQVQPDFELIAFDFVSNPSTHGAFLSPVNESVDKNQSSKSNLESWFSSKQERKQYHWEVISSKEKGTSGGSKWFVREKIRDGLAVVRTTY